MADWPDEDIAMLRRLWDEGHSTAVIGRRMFRTKCSIVGKAHRLDLPARPSPIHKRDPSLPERPSHHALSKATLPPPPSDEPETEVPVIPTLRLNPRRVRQEPPVDPVIIATHDRRVVNPFVAPRIYPNAGPSIGSIQARHAARGYTQSGEISRKNARSDFDNIAYRPVSKPEPTAHIPPSRKCMFPLWGDQERPTHKYCDEPATIRSYCAVHARRCYDGIRRPMDPDRMMAPAKLPVDMSR